MSKTIIFNAALSIESVEELVSKIETLLDTTSTDIDLYFSCSGGLSSASHILLDFLHKYQNRITLIGVDALGSNGFNIFFAYKGKKRLLADVIGIIHSISFRAEVRELSNTNSLGVYELAEVTRTNHKYLQEYQSFLSEEEQKRFTLGENVILSSERMHNLFKTQ